MSHCWKAPKLPYPHPRPCGCEGCVVIHNLRIRRICFLRSCDYEDCVGNCIARNNVGNCVVCGGRDPPICPLCDELFENCEKVLTPIEKTKEELTAEEKEATKEVD